MSTKKEIFVGKIIIGSEAMPWLLAVVLKYYISKLSKHIGAIRKSCRLQGEPINTKSKYWSRYVGLKREVTELFIALHATRYLSHTNIPKVQSHCTAEVRANSALLLAVIERGRTRAQKLYLKIDAEKFDRSPAIDWFKECETIRTKARQRRAQAGVLVNCTW